LIYFNFWFFMNSFTFSLCWFEDLVAIITSYIWFIYKNSMIYWRWGTFAIGNKHWGELSLSRGSKWF
jgi:hypothetical protein